MDKEIKEILRYLEECVANDNRFLIGNANATKLSYYITNLQKQLEKKDAYIKYLEKYNPKYYTGKIFYGDGREDLQQRIDKAVEYIEKDCKYFDIEDESQYEKIINVLKGDDTNEI